MSSTPNRIPVGYLTKPVSEVQKGDAVRLFGKILSVKHVGEQIFTDPVLKIKYRQQAVELKTKSVLTGRMLYEVLPIDATVEIVMYETI